MSTNGQRIARLERRAVTLKELVTQLHAAGLDYETIGQIVEVCVACRRHNLDPSDVFAAMIEQLEKAAPAQ